MHARCLITLAATQLCAGAPLIAATLPAKFSEIAVTGANLISSGTAMEFSPDGKLFVLEQAGTIEVYQGSGVTWSRLQANFFANAPLVSVDSGGERGLLGIAFDPNYVSNRFLYVYHTTSSGSTHNRIVRYTANATGDLALAGSAAVLMDLDDLSGATNHNGGAIHFGPDGKLYVAVGENADTSNSQSISTRLGKMLRLNPDPSNPIPTDNPASIAGIAGTTSGNNRAIWAAGLRNPFTFCFKPGTSVMYINDVGNTTWEEINVGAAGANYGWSSTEGTFSQASFPNFTKPIVYYNHNDGSLSVPGRTDYTGFAITGGVFYPSSGGTFPADYAGDYLFADYISDSIKRFDSANNTVQNFASSAGSPVDLRIGSDGALYYLARDSNSMNSGRVFRVQYACQGDTNGSAVVDVSDLLAVIGSWGACAQPCPPNCAADIAPATPNCVVDVSDLLMVIEELGRVPVTHAGIIANIGRSSVLVRTPSMHRNICAEFNLF